MIKVDHKKIRRGDKVLLWGTVKNVLRNETVDGENDVVLEFEDYDNASTVSLELDACHIKEYVYKKDLMTRVFEFLTKGMKLTKYEKDILSDTLDCK